MPFRCGFMAVANNKIHINEYIFKKISMTYIKVWEHDSDIFKSKLGYLRIIRYNSVKRQSLLLTDITKISNNFPAAILNLLPYESVVRLALLAGLSAPSNKGFECFAQILYCSKNQPCRNKNSNSLTV